MANNLAGRTWNLDTPGTTLLWPGGVNIRSFQWGGYTDATHKCTATDRNGMKVFEADGDTNFAPIEHHDIGWVDGFKLTVLGSGLLIVHIA